MAERLIEFIGTQADDFASDVRSSDIEIIHDNLLQFPVSDYPLIKSTEFSQAYLAHNSLDTAGYEYPDYVNHEHFIIGPQKWGKNTWLVGGQENVVNTLPLNANTFLIGNILVDPGSYEGIPSLIENIGQVGKALDDIELVLVTHAHLDHMAAINDLQMLGLVAPVFVPEKSVDQIRNKDAAKIGKDLYKHDFEPFRIDYALRHNDSFSASGFSVTAKEGPGHSPDHMYYVIVDAEGHETFAVGDILIGGARSQFGSDKVSWSETLTTLLSEVNSPHECVNSQEPDDILTGHHFRVLHKTPNLLYEVGRFGTQESDIISSQPGMIKSWWA